MDNKLKDIAIVIDRFNRPNTKDNPFVSGTWRFMYHILKTEHFPVNNVEFLDLENIDGRENNYKLIIGLGRKVLKHYRPKDKLDSIRGSVLKEDDNGNQYRPDALFHRPVSFS